MNYGELNTGPLKPERNLKTGQYMKGHTPANKGKRWDEYMGKRAQKRAKKGWANLDLYRNKNGRSENAGRSPKKVIAVNDAGRWLFFSHIGEAAQWSGGIRGNIGRCCRMNRSRQKLNDVKGRPTDRVNTDHRYLGIRWYFENDNIWTTKIKQ